MRRQIKSYLVFTSVWYRFGVYLLMPAMLIGLSLWIEGHVQGDGEFAVILGAVLLPMAEIISDSWLFGGIQTKDSTGLEYLKTSGQGLGILGNALWVDFGRKFLFALCIIALCRLGGILMAGKALTFVNFWGSFGVETLLYFVLMCYFVSTLGTFLSRFSGILWVNCLIGYGATGLMAFGMILLNLGRYLLIINVLLGILDILGSVLAVRIAQKRVERSYYDQ